MLETSVLLEIFSVYVVKLLGPDEKRIQHNLSGENESLSVLWQSETTNETLVHHFQPETKETRGEISIVWTKIIEDQDAVHA